MSKLNPSYQALIGQSWKNHLHLLLHLLLVQAQGKALRDMQSKAILQSIEKKRKNSCILYFLHLVQITQPEVKHDGKGMKEDMAKERYNTSQTTLEPRHHKTCFLGLVEKRKKVQLLPVSVFTSGGLKKKKENIC